MGNRLCLWHTSPRHAETFPLDTAILSRAGLSAPHLYGYAKVGPNRALGPIM